MAYLFTYGLLMDPQRMREQCSPSVRVTCTARLTGYRFRYSSYHQTQGSGTPNISKSRKGESVWGVIYEIPLDELLFKLDGCVNGISRDIAKQEGYIRETLDWSCIEPATPECAPDKKQTCYIYHRNFRHNNYWLELKDPPDWFRKELAELAKEFGFPADYIQKTILRR